MSGASRLTGFWRSLKDSSGGVLYEVVARDGSENHKATIATFCQLANGAP